MKIVLQRVQRASVSVDGQVIGKIDKGFLLLTGISHTDDEKTADKMMDKICRLRIFEDDQGKTNLSLWMWAVRCWLSASSPCTPTAARETVPDLPMQVRRSGQSSFMNTWLRALKKGFR